MGTLIGSKLDFNMETPGQEEKETLVELLYNLIKEDSDEESPTKNKSRQTSPISKRNSSSDSDSSRSIQSSKSSRSSKSSKSRSSRSRSGASSRNSSRSKNSIKDSSDSSDSNSDVEKNIEDQNGD